MRKLVLSALILSAYPLVGVGQTIEGAWTYIIENGGATITASTATGAVTIPSELGGYAVKKVGNGWPPTFGNNSTSVTSVVIPNSVTSIGYYAFYGCTSLTSITIPNSVTNIEDHAFSDCTSLASLTIPNSVTSIGEGAFYGCTSLTSIIIPNSVTSIGYYAFSNCTSLTSVTIPFYTKIEIDSFECLITRDFTSLVGRDDFVNTLVSKLANTLATNSTFITNLAEAIKSANGTYGLTTQTGLSSAIEPLATKTQITTAINEGRASGIASVTASPNTWSLFTTSQIQNMAVGDLVLTRTNGSNLVLNYDIEQSEDLQTWTTYQGYALPLTNLPTNKAFVRIKAKQ